MSDGNSSLCHCPRASSQADTDLLVSFSGTREEGRIGWEHKVPLPLESWYQVQDNGNDTLIQNSKPLVPLLSRYLEVGNRIEPEA